ncbi:molecular chaperone MKKS-like [Amphiura filiformis]|uniref:molecular chaperone MKKS-like n=1 Tax=Amphiura filiformis TaxID=82378 RepID=UPI003B2288CE
MCASSPGLGHRSLPNQQANIKTYTLKSQQVLLAISTFKQILQSCYGPMGHAKMIQNNSGGYMTTTSASSQLLQNLTVSKPVLKLMVAAIQGHLSRFGDGGLYCGLLMSSLVDTCIGTGLHPVLCCTINEHLAQKCLQLLDSIKIPVDIADMKTMICIVRSVIETKPLCNLTHKELDYISALVLEAFLKAVPSIDSSNTMSMSHIEQLSVEGFPAHQSRVLDGVLLEATKFMTVLSKTVTMPQVQSGPQQGQIRVALYDISMAGDSQNFVDVDYEFMSDVSAEDVVVSEMMRMAERLVADEVGLVACQKVIHPTVKKFFKESGVWTLDRLSRMHIDAVHKVTGAQIISTFNPDLLGDTYGYLTSANMIDMYNKSYVHLLNHSQPICTMALCSRTGAVLEELKNVCNVANQTLGLILSNPMVLPGAGCTETYIASNLNKYISSTDESCLEELRCTRAQYLTVANNFASCFEAVAMSLEHDRGSHVTDPTNHHRYSIPPGLSQDSDWLNVHNICACGITTFHTSDEPQNHMTRRSEYCELPIEKVGNIDESSSPVTSLFEANRIESNNIGTDSDRQASKKTVVLDCFSIKRNALCIAVETANMVLRIKHTLEDTN